MTRKALIHVISIPKIINMLVKSSFCEYNNNGMSMVKIWMQVAALRFYFYIMQKLPKNSLHIVAQCWVRTVELTVPNLPHCIAAIKKIKIPLRPCGLLASSSLRRINEWQKQLTESDNEHLFQYVELIYKYTMIFLRMFFGKIDSLLIKCFLKCILAGYFRSMRPLRNRSDASFC